MVKVAGILVNHGGECERIFYSEETNELMFDNEPMGYCLVSFGEGNAPEFDPITLTSTEYTQEEHDMVSLLRMYTPLHRGILRLKDGEYLLIKDYSPMDLSKLTSKGLEEVEYDCSTDEIGEDDEEGLELVYLAVTLKDAGY